MVGRLKLDKRNVILLGIVAYAIAITLFYIARPGGDSYEAATIGINVTTVLIAIAAGVFAIRHFGLKSYQGKSVSFLTAACVLWLAADLMWSYYELATVSFADVLYLIGYPIILMGIFFGIKTFNPDFAVQRKRIAVLALISLAGSVAYMIFFPFSWDPEISFIENVLISGYAVADLFLLVPSIFLVSQVLSGFFSRPWIAIAAANVLNIIGDTWYNANYATYANGDPVELMWYFAYLLYAAGFIFLVYDTKKATERAMEKAASAGRNAEPAGTTAGAAGASSGAAHAEGGQEPSRGKPKPAAAKKAASGKKAKKR